MTDCIVLADKEMSPCKQQKTVSDSTMAVPNTGEKNPNKKSSKKSVRPRVPDSDEEDNITAGLANITTAQAKESEAAARAKEEAEAAAQAKEEADVAVQAKEEVEAAMRVREEAEAAARAKEEAMAAVRAREEEVAT